MQNEIIFPFRSMWLGIVDGKPGGIPGPWMCGVKDWLDLEVYAKHAHKTEAEARACMEARAAAGRA